MSHYLCDGRQAAGRDEVLPIRSINLGSCSSSQKWIKYSQKNLSFRHKWDANLKTSHLKTIFSHLQSLSSLNLKNILITSAWWFIKINLSPPCSKTLKLLVSFASCTWDDATAYTRSLWQENIFQYPSCAIVHFHPLLDASHSLKIDL